MQISQLIWNIMNQSFKLKVVKESTYVRGEGEGKLTKYAGSNHRLRELEFTCFELNPNSA